MIPRNERTKRGIGSEREIKLHNPCGASELTERARERKRERERAKSARLDCSTPERSLAGRGFCC